MIFQKGQKAKIQDLGVGESFVVKCYIKTNLSIDMTCFGVDENNKLSDDRYMIFYNQKASPGGEVKLTKDSPDTEFQVSLSNLPSSIVKLFFTAAIDGSQTMNQISSLDFAIGEHTFNLTGSDFNQEKAIIIAEIYKKDGVWRVGAVGQGFNGGLNALLTYFGGEVAEEKKESPPIKLSTVDLNKKVFLEKRINLEKSLETSSPKLLNLSKKAAISLEKKGLGEHKAKVALCLDISGSMAKIYASGAIQEFAERILALGCRLDDDGSIDVFLFGENGYQPNALTVTDFPGYVTRMLKVNKLEGDTKYSKAMELVRKFYTPSYKYERSEPLCLDTPIYIMFLTDGQPSDKMAATKALKNASYEPIFWQFMGIKGGGFSTPDFSYLEKLDDLEGRYVDNADFFSVGNIAEISDDVLYEKLMNEYPNWLKEAKIKGLLA
ncbi:tellurium resistance protein [archaeon]|nr:tellurium resistance protein [archaeon]